MSKIKNVLFAIALIIIGVCSLASCSESYDFYEDFLTAGADIDKDHNFVAISVDEAKNKIDNGDDFVLFLGTSSEEKQVTSVTVLQTEFDYYDYDGKVYFIDTTDILEKGRTKIEELTSKLGIREINTGSGLDAVEYRDGKQIFDSSKSDGDEIFYLDGKLNYAALAQYIVWNYPVTE